MKIPEKASEGGGGFSGRAAPGPGTRLELGNALLKFSGEGDVCAREGLKNAAAAAARLKVVNSRWFMTTPSGYLSGEQR